MNRLLAILLATACFRSDTIPNDGRFNAHVLTWPSDGYTDSTHINAAGDRIYFAHSYLAPLDFLNGTSLYTNGQKWAGGDYGAGVDYNTDLWYIQWDKSTSKWSYPINVQLGDGSGASSINSFGNECCDWLNPSETEIIYFTDAMGLGGVHATGNYRATRPTRDSSWGTPAPLPGSYGTVNQNTASLYRHDVVKGQITGDLYLWEKNVATPSETLLWGQNLGGTYAAPVSVPGVSPNGHLSQPWISPDELTLLYVYRPPSGASQLMRSTRTAIGNSWTAGTAVPLSGFSDSLGAQIWGQPRAGGYSGIYWIGIAFDTSISGWKSIPLYFPCGPAGPCTAIHLN